METESLKIAGLFREVPDAEEALTELLTLGISREHVSVLVDEMQLANEANRTRLHPFQDQMQIFHTSGDVTGAAAGGAIGGALGGAVGFLAGIALLAIPTGGSILAAGPLLAALGGAGMGAMAGGSVGALTDMGLAEHVAEEYFEGVVSGGILVVVECAPELTRSAQEVLTRFGAVGVEACDSRHEPSRRGGGEPLPSKNSQASRN